MARRLAVALSFLTRFPADSGDTVEADVGRSLAFFPLVGLLLGLLLVAAAWLLVGRVPVAVVALILVALLATLTGGLHLDGLADTFDALGARGDAARRLEVLRDSRIGAHGASALALLLLLKAAALQEVLAAGSLGIVLVFPAVARAVVALEVVLLPYARPSGLGTAFRAHARGADVLAALLVAGLSALLALGSVGLLAGVATAVLVLGFARCAARRFGGVTGDVYGASIEIGETAFLVLTLATP
ncbi:MAG: adenosylcobinamide-GDP ribazoletransferase [Thermodesulfobacteriota bacterium]